MNKRWTDDEVMEIVLNVFKKAIKLADADFEIPEDYVTGRYLCMDPAAGLRWVEVKMLTAKFRVIVMESDLAISPDLSILYPIIRDKVCLLHAGNVLDELIQDEQEQAKE